LPQDLCIFLSSSCLFIAEIGFTPFQFIIHSHPTIEHSMLN
jgi:hypothetical protein